MVRYQAHTGTRAIVAVSSGSSLPGEEQSLQLQCHAAGLPHLANSRTHNLRCLDEDDRLPAECGVYLKVAAI